MAITYHRKITLKQRKHVLLWTNVEWFHCSICLFEKSSFCSKTIICLSNAQNPSSSQSLPDLNNEILKMLLKYVPDRSFPVISVVMCTF